MMTCCRRCHPFHQCLDHSHPQHKVGTRPSKLRRPCHLPIENYGAGRFQRELGEQKRREKTRVKSMDRLPKFPTVPRPPCGEFAFQGGARTPGIHVQMPPRARGTPIPIPCVQINWSFPTPIITPLTSPWFLVSPHPSCCVR